MSTLNFKFSVDKKTKTLKIWLCFYHNKQVTKVTERIKNMFMYISKNLEVMSIGVDIYGVVNGMTFFGKDKIYLVERAKLGEDTFVKIFDKKTEELLKTLNFGAFSSALTWINKAE